MKPILASAYPYTGNGLGGLPDAIECVVSHEINGIYELQMRYPVTGLHFDEIESGRFIMAKPDDLTNAQPFRVYRITKPLNGVVTVYARHICYDMQGIVVEPFTAGSLTEAFQTIPTVLTPANSFNLQTTRTVASGITLKEPRPLWKLLGGQAGSLLDVYGGEWDFDGYNAKLVTQLGTNRGVSIRYGKNMTEMEQDATIESAFSGVYPFWYDEETNTLVTLTEKYVTVPGAIVSDRVLTLDFSDDFDTQPSEQDLRDRANAYITANSVGNAKTSWKVSFVDTRDLPLDKVQLGDTLSVHYERLNVDATARAVKTEYDVLADRYKAVTIGKVKQNLAQIIVDNEQKNDEGFKQTKSDYEQKIDQATYSITHGAGEFRLIYNGLNVKEIVSLDDPDITQALSVWRWNNGGFGHSSTGYSGPYTLALLPDGSINASMITVGTLNVDVARAGTLQDVHGYNSFNLETGAFRITNGSIDIETTNETYDVIKFHNNQWHNAFAPLEYRIWNETTEKAVLVQAGGIWLYNNYDGNGGEVTRTLLQDGSIYQYDASGNMRSLFDFGDVRLYDATETARAHLASSRFATGGSLALYDNSGNERTRADVGGLTLLDAGGNTTGQFPDGVNFNSDLSVYSARGTINYAVARKWGMFRYVNIVFAASYNGTASTARIIDVGADNTPSYGHALTCIDVTNGSSYVDSSIPCKVGTTGGIYANSMQNGHLYVITGLYFVGSQNA